MPGLWRGFKTGEQRQPPSGLPAYYGIVDPGTSTLRLLVAEVVDGQATVWGWDEGPGWTGEDAPRLALTCEEILAQAEAMARARADRWFPASHMLVGLPASQLQGRAWCVTQRRLQPELAVEERELQVLLGRALRLAVNQLRRLGSTQPGRDSPQAAPGSTRATAVPPADRLVREGHASRDSDDLGWVLVDATAVALTVDGRRVTDPVGFRGREIGATVFAALASAETIETWRRVAKGLEFSTLTLTAAPLALALGLAEFQGVLLDVGGETTDLTLWQAGRPVALDSLPVGGAALTRSLIRAWDLSLDKAEHLKRVYAGGYLAGGDRDRVQEAMFPALRSWYEEAELALARLREDEPLPQRFYLLGGGSALPEMIEAARALVWSERLSFERYPQVGRLHPTDVPGVVNRTELGRGTGDVSALALAAWAARQGRSADRPTLILREICERQC